MPDNRRGDLCAYRMAAAQETLQVAKECLNGNHYKDAINRSYYAVFYGVRAVLALDSIDFKRHKDVVAYFNKEFVAAGKFPSEMGRRLARLKMKREESDYNDFFIASADEAQKQLESVEYMLPLIKEYLEEHDVNF